jgi:hypothetical protein
MLPDNILNDAEKEAIDIWRKTQKYNENMAALCSQTF